MNDSDSDSKRQVVGQIERPKGTSGGVRFGGSIEIDEFEFEFEFLPERPFQEETGGRNRVRVTVTREFGIRNEKKPVFGYGFELDQGLDRKAEKDFD